MVSAARRGEAEEAVDARTGGAAQLSNLRLPEATTNSDIRGRGWSTARFWKPLEAAAACLALITWFGAMALWMYYDATRPITPDPTTGRIYPQNTHGSIVYLIRQEEMNASALMWVGGVLMVVAIGIDMSVRPFRRQWQ